MVLARSDLRLRGREINGREKVEERKRGGGVLILRQLISSRKVFGLS